MMTTCEGGEACFTGNYSPNISIYSPYIGTKVERGLLWRVKRHIQALIPARISTQMLHECADLCIHIVKKTHFNRYEHDL